MRPSLLLCTVLLSLGCARSMDSMGRDGDAVPTGDGGAAVASTPSGDPGPRATAEAQPPPSGAMPAAGAGADDAGPPATTVDQRAQAGTLASEPRRPGPRDASRPAEPPGAAQQCRRDEDCTLTMVPEGGCCPLLCVGRAVSKAEALKADERQRTCEARGTPCPDPVCARPRGRPVPVCTGGRCDTRMMPMEER